MGLCQHKFNELCQGGRGEQTPMICQSISQSIELSISLSINREVFIYRRGGGGVGNSFKGNGGGGTGRR